MLDLDVATVPREELPAILGKVVEIEARIRIRLTEPAQAVATADSRLVDADEAATIAGTNPRWILSHTRGLKFRRDLSRKQPRFDEAGLRAWLASRRRS